MLMKDLSIFIIFSFCFLVVVVVVDLPAFSSTTAMPVAPSSTTEFPPWTEADIPLQPNGSALRDAGLRAGDGKCFRYVYGYFGGNVTVIGMGGGEWDEFMRSYTCVCVCVFVCVHRMFVPVV